MRCAKRDRAEDETTEDEATASGAGEGSDKTSDFVLGQRMRTGETGVSLKLKLGIVRRESNRHGVRIAYWLSFAMRIPRCECGCGCGRGPEREG